MQRSARWVQRVGSLAECWLYPVEAARKPRRHCRTRPMAGRRAYKVFPALRARRSNDETSGEELPPRTIRGGATEERQLARKLATQSATTYGLRIRASSEALVAETSLAIVKRCSL